MAQWIIGLIEQHGYLAIAVLMFIENIFPPVPSELIMTFAGYVAARGDLGLIAVVVSGTAGSLLGTLPWYFAGRAVGIKRLMHWAERHGRWLTVSPQDLESAQQWFDRRGAMAVTLGRLMPALRSVISAPAGIAAMPIAKFLMWSALGSLVWTGLLAGIGYLLEGRHDQIARWLDPVSTAIVAVAVLAYGWRVITFKRRTSTKPGSRR